jgi:hypothetical protein
MQTYFPHSKLQICITSFFEEIVEIAGLYQNRSEEIERIFLAPSIQDADDICNDLLGIWSENHFLLKRIKKYLSSYISCFYDYPSKTRMLTGTTNIITYITYIIKMLINNERFNSINEANKYISIASRKILENGVKFIPGWNEMTGEIR